MGKILVALSSYIISGLIFRLLASVGFGLATATFVNFVISDYLTRSVNMMGTGLDPDISAYLNILRADDCISIIMGATTFVAVYKSLKLIFFKN